MKKEILIQVIAGIILTLSGIFIGRFFEEKEDENPIGYFDYDIEIGNPIYASGITKERELAITLDGKKVKNLKEITIYGFNPNKNDLKEIPIYINIASKDSVISDSIDILYSNIVGVDNSDESIEIIKNEINKNEINIGFILKYANRYNEETGIENAFKATFLINSISSLGINLNVTQAGLEKRIFKYSNYFKAEKNNYIYSFIDVTKVVLFYFIVFSIALVIYQYFFLKLIVKKINKEYEIYYNDILKTIFNKYEVAKNSTEKIIEEISNIEPQETWNRFWKEHSILKRILYGKNPPKVIDTEE